MPHETVTYEATVGSILFCPGTSGPWFVTVHCDDIKPPLPASFEAPDNVYGFQIDGAEVYTMNGIGVTVREAVIDLCGNIENRSAKVRIVWDEHRYGNVREAHFTTEVKP